MDDPAAYEQLLRQVIRNQQLIDQLIQAYGLEITRILIRFGYKGQRPRQEIKRLVQRFIDEYSDVVINGVATAASLQATAQDRLLIPRLRNVGATTEALSMRGYFRGYEEQVRRRFPTQLHENDRKSFVQRVKRLERGTQEGIYAVMKQAVDEGTDPRKVAYAIQNSVLMDPRPSQEAWAYSKKRMVAGTYLGHGTPYGSVQYNAMRIVRTEMARQYRNGMFDFYEGKVYNEGYDWVLSNRHKKTDQCDVFASSGPYADRKECPSGHPLCLCRIVARIMSQERLLELIRSGALD